MPIFVAADDVQLCDIDYLYNEFAINLSIKATGGILIKINQASGYLRVFK